MPTSGVDAPPEAVAALYAEFDADHSGSVSYAELSQQLRDEYCGTPELPEQQGAPRVRFELRKGAQRGLSPARTPESMTPQLGHFCKLDVDWGFDKGGGFEYLELTGDTLQEKLRAALKKGWCGAGSRTSSSRGIAGATAQCRVMSLQRRCGCWASTRQRKRSTASFARSTRKAREW